MERFFSFYFFRMWPMTFPNIKVCGTAPKTRLSRLNGGQANHEDPAASFFYPFNNFDQPAQRRVMKDHYIAGPDSRK
jgi:hypothetical protein